MRLVRDSMVREVVAVASDTSLEAVARLFALNDVSGAPVVDDAGRPLGVITQPDLVDPGRPRSGQVGRTVYYRVWNGDVRAMGVIAPPVVPMPGVATDVMTTPLLTVDRNAPIAEAARVMVRERVHRLFIVEKGRIMGVVSALDCLRALVGGDVLPERHEKGRQVTTAPTMAPASTSQAELTR